MPEYEIEMTSLAYGGEALGRLPDGKAAFVPFALPGERVRVRLVEEKRGHTRLELLEVLQASPARIAPRCSHFGVCGGCHYQHLQYTAQLEAKTAILKEQLERIGRLVDPPVRPCVASPQAFHYRNHVQFHLTAGGAPGFMRAGSESVFALRECHLPQPPLDLVWRQLDFEALPELERIGLRLGVGEELQLTLESHDAQAPEFSVEELPLSAVHLSPAGSLVLAGSGYVIMEVLGRPFRVSAGSFFQVNSFLAGELVYQALQGVAAYAPLAPGATVLEVYCGVGLFSAFLAEQGWRVVGIEASPYAADDFVANLDEFDHVELYEGAAQEILPHLDLKPAVVLVDPPRSGVERPALEALLRMRPELLVYISCDPATLGRDARRLVEGGYRLEQVTPFDMFPQTYHIESLSFWRPASQPR
jgi:23S rRNA (uracil1939-C5)-methyltransferase